MVKVMQLMLQCVAYECDVKHHKLQSQKEIEVLVDCLIQGMANISMSHITSEVAGIPGTFQSLKTHDLNAMFAKVLHK